MSLGNDDTVASTLSDAPAGAAAVAEGGELIAGRYQVVRWLGGGGMGRVYEARDNELGERVALKVLHNTLSDDAVERFRREVRLARRVQHRNVARMFDIGEHRAASGERTRFLTMELVDGAPLTRAYAAPLAWDRLRDLALQICAGLAAAHAAGVVHRDLKPDNVLVERGTGRAVLTDFGIARGGGDESVTVVGAIVGTPRYMAPEQLAGAAVDTRADLFSLGVMLFELASGARPWDGDGPIAIAVAQATQPPRKLVAPDVPAGAIALIMSCLSLDPEQRPASAETFAAALGASAAAGVTLAGTGAGAVAAAAATRAAQRSLAPALTVPGVRLATALAVMPFTSAPEDAYLADGLREDLVDTLSTTPGLRVRAAGAAARSDADPREIGRALEVDQIVSGAVRRTPAGLRVTARMTSVADGFQIWAQRADVTDAEILALADELSRAIASALSARATPVERPTDPRAIELYLRARAELRRFWADHAIAAANLLEEAVAIAPESPQILSAFAFASVQAWQRGFDTALLPRAEAAVARALATQHGEALLASGLFRINRGDVIDGIADLGTALARSQMSASAHETAGRFLLELHAEADARRHFEIALALDPGRGPVLGNDLARLDALEGDWASARRYVDVLQADPDRSVNELGLALEARLAAWQGDIDGSIAAVERMTRGAGDSRILIQLLSAWRNTGSFDRELWAMLVAQLTRPGPPRRVQLGAAQRSVEAMVLMEHHDLGLELMLRAIDRGLIDITWFDRCPLLERVRDDAAWAAARDELARSAERALAGFRAALAAG